MKQLVRILGLALGLTCLITIAPPAQAQQNAKLYFFTSGSLGGFPKAALQICGKGDIHSTPVSFHAITLTILHSRSHGFQSFKVTPPNGRAPPLGDALCYPFPALLYSPCNPVREVAKAHRLTGHQTSPTRIFHERPEPLADTSDPGS